MKYISEKLWRLDVAWAIENNVRQENKELAKNLNMKHSKSDIRLFQLKKHSYIEEDVFKYFYPFCLTNCTFWTAILLRKSGLAICTLSTVCMAEYVYFLFSFPVESFHFHKTALNPHKKYSQYLRDTYIARFPTTFKSQQYRNVNEKINKSY